MLTALARAKVNLFLSVMGQREDGLHALESLCVFPPVGDRITLNFEDGRLKSQDLSLRVSGPFAPALQGLRDDDNLVMRVAHELRMMCALQPGQGSLQGVVIQLEKNLPPTSGIGGGTSDAMATLYLLNDMWRLGLSNSQMLDLAFRLGADGPVCLLPHLQGWFAGSISPSVPSVIFSGAGEDVMTGPDLPSFAMVLANPGMGVATSEVFRKYAARPLDSKNVAPARKVALPSSIENFAALVDYLSQFKNDLEEAACSCVPEIETLLSKLSEEPGCALSRMSGSGATCFGLFATLEAAQHMADALADAYNIWALACHFEAGDVDTLK